MRPRAWSGLWLLVWGVAEAQSAPPPAGVSQELRIYVYEEFDEENEHEHYEQPHPVEVPFGAQGAGGVVRGSVTLMSGCAWRRKDPLPASLGVPWPGGPPQEVPPADPDWGKRPDPWDSTSAPSRTNPLEPLTLTLRVSSLNTRLRIGSGSVFGGALNTQGSPVGTSPPAGGAPVPGSPPQPPPPPPQTKSILGGNAGSDGSAGSDVPLLAGPEMTVPLKAAVAEWGFLGWMPASSQLAVYGHALFGEMRVMGRSVDVALYGLGPRLGVPLWVSSAFRVDGLLSAGPALLRTDLGESAAVDVAGGVGAHLRLVGALSLSASAEFRGTYAPDARAHGPSFNLGLNLGW